MNFQQVTENLTDMKGLLFEVGGVTMNKNNKQMCKCKVQDDQGVKHNVTFYMGKKGIPSPNDLNQWGIMSISSYQGNYQGKDYTGYSGFWNGVAAQPPQNTLQPASAAKQGGADWDAKDFRIIAQCFGKIFAEQHATGKMEFDEATLNAKSWAIWAWNLKREEPIQPGDVTYEEPVMSGGLDDDIPF